VVQAVLAAIPRAAAVKHDLLSPSPSPSAPSAPLPQHGLGRYGAHRIRYAEPGEFTRRAFFNNRLDLTQVEALGDTLAAVTEQQRRLSVRNAGAGGGTSSSSSLSQRYEAWRRLLLAARAELEALIDFSEEQQLDDAPSALVAGVATRVRRLRAQLRAHSRNAMRGELLRGGLQLCLLGAANAGKSSLLNRIVGRDAAIVSAEAGTTRDVLDVGVDVGGWYCRLGDMAGIRLGGGGGGHCGAGDDDSSSSGRRRREGGSTPATPVGEVEAEGIRRAKQRALESDVAVVVLSVEHDDTCAQHGGVDMQVAPEVAEVARERSSGSSSSQGSGDSDGRRATVVVVNKLDRAPRGVLAEDWIRKIQAAIPNVPRHHIFGTSCKLAATARVQEDGSVNGVGNNNVDDNNADGTTVLDPGGIQAFLNGLMGVFKELTRPIVPMPQVNDHHDPTAHHHQYQRLQTAAAGLTAEDDDGLVWEESLGASKRQALLLDECAAHLDDFLSLVDAASAPVAADSAAAYSAANIPDTAAAGFDVVVAAEKLRAAAECMAKITGRGSESGDVDEVLGVIFEK
jgi:tRNA U34 5-carboxymethylaminomethyl modifying GTPase MnmE/TrmE